MIFCSKNSVVRQYIFPTYKEMVQFIENIDPSKSNTRLVNEEGVGNLFCVYKVVNSINDAIELIIGFATEFNPMKFIVSHWNNSIIFECGESYVFYSKINRIFFPIQVSTQLTSVIEMRDGSLLLVEEAGYKIFSIDYSIIETINTGFIHSVETDSEYVKIFSDKGEFVLDKHKIL